jgi:MFS family permease
MTLSASSASQARLEPATQSAATDGPSEPSTDRSGPSSGQKRDFWLLWASQSVTVFGDQFMVLGLPLLAVTVLRATAAEAALLPAALFGPFFVLGLPAGAIVDRIPKRMTMLVSDGTQVVVFCGIALLAAGNLLSFGLLFGLVCIAGCATVFYQVAYSSYLPAIFSEPADLHRGNARLYLSESLAKALGPVVAGPVVAIVGVVGAVAANAGSFFASLLGTLAIRTKEARPNVEPRARGWLITDIKEGLRFVVNHAELEPVIVCGAVYVALVSMLDASLVLYCRDVLRLGPIAIG